MNLRSGRGSTSTRADPGDNGRGEGIGNNNGESHEALLLAPPLPPPPPMTHAEMMAEMLAARRESARALEMLARRLVASPVGVTEAMAGIGVVPAVPRGPVLTKISHIHADC